MKQRARLDIQGLRALAVVLVILFHLPAAISFRGGFVGVDMFFVISGFVVTNMVIGGSSLPGRAWRSIGSFLRRRILRLVPAAAVVISVTLVLSVIFAPTTDLQAVSKAGLYASGFLSNLFYAQNFDTYWDPAVLQSPFLHTWSLGVEFQVYLIFPLVFLAVFRGAKGASRGLKSALIVSGVLAIVSLGTFVYFLVFRSAPLGGFQSASLAFYTPVTRFWEFALGIVGAIIVERYDWAEKKSSLTATVVAWVLIIAGLIGCTVADTLSLAVIPACLGVAILAVNGARSGVERRSPLAWRPFVWIGDRSYSIYLWHWPMLVIALWILPGNIPFALASLAVTFGLSIVTYRFVEQRFRRPRGESNRWALLPSVSFVLVGVLLGGSAYEVSQQGWYASPVPLTAAAMSFPDSGPTGSDMDKAIAGCAVGALVITCTPHPGAPRVVIIGDSLGYRSTPAVDLAAKQLGYNTTMMWTGGCTIDLNSCPAWMYAYLAKTKVAAIIVNANFDRPSPVIDGNEVAAGLTPLCPAGKPITTCAAHVQSVDAFSRLAAPGLRQLDKYTKHILVALPFPQQSTLVNTCLSPSLFARLGPVESAKDCGRTSVAWQAERQGLFPAAIRKAAAADPDVTLWNPQTLLCKNGECPAVINDGDQIMSDAIHLSWEASRLPYPEYAKFLRKVKTSS